MAGITLALDNSVFSGRLRPQPVYEHRRVAPVRPRLVQDIRPTSAPVATKVSVNVKPVFHSTVAPAQVSAATIHATRAMRSEVLARNALPTHGLPSASHFSYSNMRGRLLTAAAIGLCVLGLWVGISGMITNHRAAAQVQQLTQQTISNTSKKSSSSLTVPSEVKPAANSVANYAVAPTMPRGLVIKKIGVDARILKLGTLASGALGTPPNIYDTGWYSASSLPGQQGAMVVDGHVSGPTAHGVFYGLKTLDPGDLITIQRGDGTNYTYKVVTSKVYNDNNVDMAALMTPIVAGRPGLNLITCTGALNSTKTGFQQRVIVFATLQ